MKVLPRGVSAAADELDLAILHALQLDGRAAFSRIGDALEISEQTVARRYKRLRSEGLVRVVGLVDPGLPAQTQWQLRIRARSDHVQPLAAALAARDDVSWVHIGSGGTEVMAALSAPDDADRDDLLLRKLPASTRVLDMTASSVLHRFPGPDGHDFRVPSTLITRRVTRALLTSYRGLTPEAPLPTAEDQPLLRELAYDGRATAAQLARATGWSEARASARLRTLLSSGRVYLDVDVALEPLGFRGCANLWLTVEPRSLSAVGSTLAAHPSVAFVGAVTGTANLYVVAILSDPGALYRFLDQALGPLDGIRQVETVPILRWVKQAGSILEGQRLRPN